MEIKEVLKYIHQSEELEPETLKQVFPELSSLDRQRILAMRLLVHTRAPFEDFYVFENVVLALNGLEPTIDAAEGCKPEYIWYAFDIIFKLLAVVPWMNEEVVEYVKYCHKEHGLKFLPERLDQNIAYFKKIKKLAEEGPFPLQEDEDGIQASHYLRIQEYLKRKKGK